VTDEEPGLLDTNIFIHAHSTDAHAGECRQFLAALEAGQVRAHLEPLILHELSYALPRYVKQMTRQDVAEYMLMLLSWEGVVGEKDLMAEAVQRWAGTPGLSFADAYLAALASRQGCVVFTKNLRELRGQGAEAPDPLPDGKPRRLPVRL
jgi:predicted nucleic acid-binding protein